MRPAELIQSTNVYHHSEIGRSTDTATFDELIQWNRKTCLMQALRIMRDQSEAADAVQSAFQKAFQRRDQFQGNGPFAAWLGRIVENECLMRLRNKRNAHFVSLDSPTKSNVRLDVIGSYANPEDELGWKEVVELLRKEMLRMPSLFRNVMLLHDCEQLPISDVAERLGLSVPATKSRLSRARKELRCRVGKHCGRKGSGTLLGKAAYGRMAYERAS
jgi:RNA polymerase sigma-70 factor (ECF subfamily)